MKLLKILNTVVNVLIKLLSIDIKYTSYLESAVVIVTGNVNLLHMCSLYKEFSLQPSVSLSAGAACGPSLKSLRPFPHDITWFQSDLFNIQL